MFYNNSFQRYGFWLVFLIFLTPLSLFSRPSTVSKVWVPDLGNGYYKNPILYADYSDPDVCRVGKDYYLVSSSFNCMPGLPILHSNDMVNWTIIGHALQQMIPTQKFDLPQHGDGVWAPSIRYHNHLFYIYFGDPDAGIYVTKAERPEGPWSPLILVKEGKGLIDPCPLWDDDGNAYLVHGFAGSRAGMKSVLAVCKMSPDGTKAVSEDRLVFDGHPDNLTVEGPKFYKRNGFYYIFCPAGGVKYGWQLALRSKNIYGPYDFKVVMAQGTTSINGPHQGAWVTTPDGQEDWFFHFQDLYAYGRVVLLEPMKWVDDWPVIGIDKNHSGCGFPVTSYKKPNVGQTYSVATPAESDDFTALTQGLQWQWEANPNPLWAFYHGEKGFLRLFAWQLSDPAKNLWNAPNLYLQKFPAPDFTVTTKVSFVPLTKGERGGLVVMGLHYALLAIENGDKGLILSQNSCADANKGTPEIVNATLPLSSPTVWLRVTVKQSMQKFDNKMIPQATCQFAYSLDGKVFISFGTSFVAREGLWIGAKVGLFCTRPQWNNDAGYLDVYHFSIDR